MLDKYKCLRREFNKPGLINLHPIQRGGILSKEAREALLEFGDGYSTCDWCPPKFARLDKIEKPPIREFYEDLAEFLGMNTARVVTRCREAMFIAFKMLGSPGDYVVVDSLAHYSTYLAAEFAGLRVKEVPHSGYPRFEVLMEMYRDKIEEVKKETGRLPAAVLITHVDYLYGNLNDATVVSKIAHEYGVPVVLNAAYTAGVMPVDGGGLGVDVIVSSGHKSWAASAPTGIIALTEEMARRILKTSSITGDWSGRSFRVKELPLLGCTVMGAPLITLMASFPYVVERVKRWGEELEKVQYFVKEIERIEGTRILGVKPKKHTLIHVESIGLHKVSEKHHRRGFYLYDELKKRGIVGIQPGLSKHFKLNMYGLSWDEVKNVVNAFHDIASTYGVKIQ
jgi:Sep-tRNA:Cys-tRNA synthetase